MLTTEQHKQVIGLSIEAGQKALAMRDAGLLNPTQKDEQAYSTVTDADIAASKILTEGLSGLFPDLEIISEEDEAHNKTGQYSDAIVIDPIDGTTGFVSGGDKFCVLIAFIKDQVPVHGFAYYPDPRRSEIYFTSAVNGKPFMQKVDMNADGSFELGAHKELHPRFCEDGLTVSQVYSDVGEVLGDIDFDVVKHNTPTGNISMIDGYSDLVAGPHTMMDWDIAAFDAMARGAGAVYVDVQTRQPLRYGNLRTEDRAFMVPRYMGGREELLKQLGMLKSDMDIHPLIPNQTRQP